MAAGKGFWGKLGTSMKNVTPEQWRAGAIITDKFSGGATGYLGSSFAQANISLDGTRTKDINKPPVNDPNAPAVEAGTKKLDLKSNLSEINDGK